MSANVNIDSQHLTCIDKLYHQTRKNGRRIAVKFGETVVTYNELQVQASQLANYLIENNLVNQNLVGLCMARSVEMIIAIYAILMAGCAYVPLDPEYPKNRLQYMCRDTDLRLVLTNSLIPTDLFGNEVQVINVKEIYDDVEASSPKVPDIEILPDQLAYVMYTSGSTGRPKGVMVTHGNLYNFIRIVPHVLDIFQDDVYLQSASITYALSIRQIFVPLSYGATLLVAGEYQVRDPLELFKLIKKEDVSLVDFVPSHWRSCNRLLSTLSERERSVLLDNRIRRIVTVGEPLHLDIPLQWRQLSKSSAKLVNIFGQTETTGVVSAYPIPEDTSKLGGIVPVGKSAPDTLLFILNPDKMQKVLPGETGELFVANPCVAIGYLNRPDLTQQKFKADLMVTDDQRHILYWTEDLARFTQDGQLEILGRTDQQVKIRGKRVELGEIEAGLINHPGVNEAAVIPISGKDLDHYLVAYISPISGSLLSELELLNHAKAMLPSHMIPASLNVVDNLPHTPNEKIDRKKLKQLYMMERTDPDIAIELKNKTEDQLATIWKNILGVRAVKANDIFFDIGGDSFKAVLLVTEIEKIFSNRLPVAALYEAPTIEKLADLITKNEDAGWPSLIPIKPQGSGPPLFMVHGAHGNILIYKDLAKYLNRERPIYGLQSQGLDGKTPFYTSIEEMASHYVQEIQLVQREGPYYLCGYCMGGTIALEIAQLLKKDGHRIAFLGLLETYNWSALPSRNVFDRSYFKFQKVIFHWRNVFLLGRKERRDFLLAKIRELKSRFKIWWGARLSIIQSSSHKLNERLTEIKRINDIAAFKYRPTYYSGTLHHFVPIRRYAVHNISEADWNKNIAERVDAWRMPVYPAAILLEPFVKSLANRMNMIFDELEQSQ